MGWELCRILWAEAGRIVKGQEKTAGGWRWRNEVK